ncbi:MAG TPA: heparinase II/III family protein, partial [Opitutaceae bacterium]|nr:heparinase II/III family protein [Opitutaceae bacterium]
VVEATLTLFTAAGLYGRAEQLGDEMCIAENLMLSPSYLRFPTGLLPNPADNAGLPTAPNREVFASAYRVFPTPIGLTQVSGRRDWDTLLDPPPASPRPAELPQVTSRNLESTRMAILKEGPWQVFIHYGQMAKSHIQAEALNYSVFYNNTDVTHDTGTVGYGSPLHKNYYTQGLNHNVPLINGEGEVPPQYGQLQAYSTHPAHVAAAEPGYRPDAKARRELAIDGTKLIDTATIESSTGPQKLGIALHLQGKVRLPSEFQAAPDFAKDRPKSFSYWRDVTAATYHDHASFTVNFDGAALRVTVAVPGEFKIWHASTPDSPPKRRESFYLETIGTAATFTTTYEPGTEM